MRRAECRFLSRALTGRAEECGDAGIIRNEDGNIFIGLIDALGHGRHAHDAAVIAVEYLSQHKDGDLSQLMKELHERLKRTTGAVVALCRFFTGNGSLHYVGIGNITVRILGTRTYRFVPRDGVVGYMMPSPVECRERLDVDDILLLHSDGVREHFDPSECPGLFDGSAAEIASGIMENFSKKDDDASCIVLRVLS